ncbi:MAG TPA: type II and III secretion system protein family protein [Beijerinckiaceae bacterium]|jgi:pilus assembly protein CpaC
MWGQTEHRFRCAGRRGGRSSLALAVGAPLAGITLLLAAGALSPARAQTRLVEIGENKVGGVRVVQGKSQTLQTTRGFVDLVVGDPEIADVMPLTDRTMYVLGKKLGTTNVSIYDGGRQLVGLIEVEVGYNTPKLAADVDRIAPDSGARVGSANGRTVLSGTVEDGGTAARAVNLARQYGPEVLNDMKVKSPQQVMLEVRFVEASRDAGRELGVGFDGMGKNYKRDPTGLHTSDFNVKKSGLNLVGVAGGALASGSVPFGALVGRVLSSGVQADIIIKALEDKGLARRLAEPNLIAMSGEKASFLAGGEFPIPVAGDRATNTITVTYKKFGVSLDFLPTVLANGVINLRVEPEVSQLDFTNTINTGIVAIPALNVRRASTVVELRDGQSFMIAGLLQSVNQEVQQQLPWLGDVPILGTLFRSTSFERKETDLAIIVTPRLVRPSRPGERLRTPLDNTLPGNDLDQFLVGRQEIPVASAKASGTRPVMTPGHILDTRKGATDVVVR